MSLAHCRLLELPKIADVRGNLTFIEENRHIPFDLKRVFYLYDVPAGEMRAGHANKKCEQLLIAANGSFDVLLDDGEKRVTYHLNRPYVGLYICPMIWREIDNFSSGSVCLVLASDYYDKDDYVRAYDAFKTLRQEGFLQKHGE